MAIEIFSGSEGGNFNNLNFWMVTKLKVVVLHVIIAYLYFLFLDNIIHVSISWEFIKINMILLWNF